MLRLKATDVIYINSAQLYFIYLLLKWQNVTYPFVERGILNVLFQLSNKDYYIKLLRKSLIL